MCVCLCTQVCVCIHVCMGLVCKYMWRGVVRGEKLMKGSEWRCWWVGEEMLLGKVKVVKERRANRRSWTAVGSVTSQLYSTDLHVTQLYNPTSLLFLLQINNSTSVLLTLHLFHFRSWLLHVIFLMDLSRHQATCSPLSLTSFLDYEPISRMGSHWCQAGCDSFPAQKRLPGLSSPPLLTSGLFWWGEIGICCLLWQRLAWENFTKNRQSCVCVYVIVKTDYVRMRGVVLA